MNLPGEFDDADEQWPAERLARASYKELGSRHEVEERFKRHLLSSPNCRASLENLLASCESTTTRDYSLEIDVFDLLEGDPILGHLLLRHPGNLMECLELAIVTAQTELFRQHQAEGTESALQVKGDSKTRVHARLIHLPPTCCKMSLGSLQSSDVGKIVQCSGTVVRTTPVCMYESLSRYKCGGKQGCGKEFNVEADLGQRHNALIAPTSCKGQNCKGKSFTKTNMLHTDYQEVTIQESASQLGGAHVPRSLLIKLQHDLCDTCQPGDEVIIVGVLLAHWHQSVVANTDCQVGMALRAHSIRVIQDKSASAWANSASASGPGLGTDMGDEDKFRLEFKAFWEDPRNLAAPIAARDYICKAVCPKLYGMAIIKLALLITLVGGVCHYDNERNRGLAAEGDPDESHDDDDEPEPFQIVQNQPYGQPTPYNETATSKSKKSAQRKTVQTRRRGQSHLLLVGDPGTGKSQFLRFAAAICPRSVLTTGVGTTSAGLTCAAVRENGKEFSLEAGALVLADQGVCCIDEFGCIRNEDRCTIHEAMEQQTLSVAKAGIVCKLNCRATIVGVMNPVDCIYDNQASLSRNTGLGTPLLSRFDTIFKLVDTSDMERDYNVTKYLLNRAILQGSESEKTAPEGANSMDTPWTMDKLRAYISFVREKFQPEMTDEAAVLLERHYEKLRSAQSSTIPVTVRFLESIIRLSQAHARLTCHKQVKLDDAVAVIRVMECTAFCFGGFDGFVDNYEDVLYCDPMTIDFSEQADLDFLCFKAQILKRYGMEHMMAPGEYQQVQQASGGQLSDGWDGTEKGDDRGCSWHNDPFCNDPKRRRQC